MKLEVGKWYRDRRGRVRHIDEKLEDDMDMYPFLSGSGDDCISFMVDGRNMADFETEWDLIEEVPKYTIGEALIKFKLSKLSPERQADYRELLRHWHSAEDQDERDYILRAIADLLDQVPIDFVPLEDTLGRLSPSPSATSIPADPDTSHSCRHRTSCKPDRPAKR